MSFELSIKQTSRLQSIAILMMLYLHLFNRSYHGLFEPVFFIDAKPLSYYISIFCDICVPVFAFVSGYGLFFKYEKTPKSYFKNNFFRIRKLYLNYWIILIIFVLLLGPILNKKGFPGTFIVFFNTLTAIDISYNGAWWFLTAYILFVFSSSFWFKLLKSEKPLLFLLILLLLYLLGAYLKIYKREIFSFPFLKLLHKLGAIYFFTLFQFMLGAFALRFKWITLLHIKLKKLPHKNYFLILCLLILFFFRLLIPSIIFAPFIALIFIFLFSQFSFGINSFFLKSIDFLAPHTTNIWLIHMFFYVVYFKTLIYLPKYSVLIFLWLLLLCLLSSFFINYLKKTILKLIINNTNK